MKGKISAQLRIMAKKIEAMVSWKKGLLNFNRIGRVVIVPKMGSCGSLEERAVPVLKVEAHFSKENRHEEGLTGRVVPWMRKGPSVGARCLQWSKNRLGGFSKGAHRKKYLSVEHLRLAEDGIKIVYDSDIQQ